MDSVKGKVEIVEVSTRAIIGVGRVKVAYVGNQSMADWLESLEGEQVVVEVVKNRKGKVGRAAWKWEAPSEDR